MALAPGTQAPTFTLKSMGPNGLEDVTPAAFRGEKPSVLLFFPLAFTGVCTQEFCEVTAGLSAYEALHAEVLGISVDSPFAQEAWAKKEGIRIRLLSDLDKKVAKAYDVIFPGLAGIGDTSARAVFVIGKDGVIYHSEQTPSPKELPDFQKVQAALAQLS